MLQVGFFLALAAALGFSTKAIFVKLAYAFAVNAITLMLLRMAFSLPLFLFIEAQRRKSSPHAPALINFQLGMALVVLGFLGYYLSSWLDFKGLEYITASLERLILFTYPLLTLLLNRCLFKKKLYRHDIGALLVCYLGIVLVFAHDLSFASNAVAIAVGAMLVLGSAFSYALYLSLSAPYIAQLGSSRFTTMTMMASTLMVTVHFGLTVRSWEALQALFALPWQIYAYALMMAVFSTVIPAFAQSAAIARIGSSKAAMIGMVGPAITIVLGYFILHEPMSMVQWAGTIVVTLGVLWTGKTKRDN
jgi:drug/metabolite transporter (DMT)-like permease